MVSSHLIFGFCLTLGALFTLTLSFLIFFTHAGSAFWGSCRSRELVKFSLVSTLDTFTFRNIMAIIAVRYRISDLLTQKYFFASAILYTIDVSH